MSHESILHVGKFEPLDVAEVLTMRQVLVLRIHADGALVLAELVGCQGSLEGIVVTVVTSHLQRFNTEDLFVALLVETNVDFLQSDGIVESLFVDDILDVVLLTSLATCCGEVPLDRKSVV